LGVFEAEILASDSSPDKCLSNMSAHQRMLGWMLELNILFDRGHNDISIIGVEISMVHRSSSPKVVEASLSSFLVENGVNRVDGQHHDEGLGSS
jgi:hypothetical protein